MKKIILSMSACMLLMHSYAQQQKWYVMATGAAGISSIRQGSQWPDPYISSMAGFNAQAKIGYHISNWRIETGVQYKQTGYKQGLIFGSSFPDMTPTGYMKQRFGEIAIPVDVGYQIALSPKFMLVPYLGVSAGYALGLNYTTKAPNEAEHSGKVDNKDFKDFYSQVNVWGNTALHVEYKLSPRFEIVAGPAFQYMINNALKQPASPVPQSNYVQHNYFLGGDVGLKVNL